MQDPNAGHDHRNPDGATRLRVETDLSLAERSRQREIHSYLLAASIVPTTHILGADPNTLPERSSDPTLTALVQLAALRLGTERAFLSFVDGDTQYIVAEATQTTSLAAGGGSSVHGDLFLGTVRFNKSYGLCPAAIDFFTSHDGSLRCDNVNIRGSSSYYIIQNLLAIEELREREYIKNWPYMQAFMEVPIVSRSGYVLGGLSVIDNKTRTFEDDDIKVLTEICQTIVSHLDHVKTKLHQAKSVSLVKGLSKFIGETTNTSVDEEAAQIVIDIPQQHTYHCEKPCGGSAVINTGLSFEESHVSSTIQFDGRQAQSRSSGSEDSTDSHGFARSSTMPSEVRKAFKRSADLIRGSLGFDGFVYLDASAVATKERSQRESDLDVEFGTAQSDPSFQLPESPCAVIASSVEDRKAAVNTAQFIPFDQGLLDRLAQRFPRGRLFSADQFGTLQGLNTPSSACSNNGFFESGPDEQRATDVEVFLAHIPGATTAFFLPMYHWQKERWYAAAVGWSCDPTFSFASSDAAYLHAFANTVMAEVLRFEALAISTAKSDFISSISHELRSPLHGVLATSELLSEILQDGEERAMLAMIQSSAYTLQDTLEHLLEFAKINKLKAVNGSATQSDEYTTTEADLSLIVEEVTDTCCAGHIFESTPHRSLQACSSQGGVKSPVLVTLDIGRSDCWTMLLHTGAWRRICMNLLGNALKYTSSGQIAISLHILDSEIMLRVKDTGRGIGEEYLKHKLFQPFAQENTLVAGTGLGLAIVQRIVQNMGGTVTVHSEVNVGTTVSVQIPLGTVAVTASRRDHDHLAGKRLCLIQQETASDQQPDDPELAYAQRVRCSVQSIAEHWFGMDVCTANAQSGASADVYIIDGSLVSVSDIRVPSHIRGNPIVILGGARSRFQSHKSSLPLLRIPFGPHQFASAISNAIAIAKTGSTHAASTRSSSSSSADPLHASRASIPHHPRPTTPPPVTASSPVKPPHSTTPTAPSQQHILIVDDNAINLKILSKVLDRIRCPYSAATDGAEAFAVYKDALSSPSPITLVFMDINMPVCDGFDATRRIRQLEKEAGLVVGAKIVALTGLGDKYNEGQAFACGMDVFWTKPVKLAKVRELLLKNE